MRCPRTCLDADEFQSDGFLFEKKCKTIKSIARGLIWIQISRCPTDSSCSQRKQIRHPGTCLKAHPTTCGIDLDPNKIRSKEFLSGLVCRTSERTACMFFWIRINPGPTDAWHGYTQNANILFKDHTKLQDLADAGSWLRAIPEKDWGL